VLWRDYHKHYYYYHVSFVVIAIVMFLVVVPKNAHDRKHWIVSVATLVSNCSIEGIPAAAAVASEEGAATVALRLLPGRLA